ncbi:hypothetical protein I79_004891 [Cricetulus griseus]|uniref:Uncharacterized protein n=1 Tax=Cricetulus griseus TaxID=10029 RepID=G3H3R2_CRIGR|nr:hypothetical protein I79_004891 [Cricetulus griseus]
MSAVQGGSKHSWPWEAQGSSLGPERQSLCSLPTFCLALFMFTFDQGSAASV